MSIIDPLLLQQLEKAQNKNLLSYRTFAEGINGEITIKFTNPRVTPYQKQRLEEYLENNYNCRVYRISHNQLVVRL